MGTGYLDKLFGKKEETYETYETYESWARKLKDKKNYRALAAIHNSQNYSEEFQIWEKKDLANDILRGAGSEAVNAILEELATDGVGNDDLARLLVDIGDPKAVRLLKKMLDRGSFFIGDELGRREIENFVEKHTEIIREMEVEMAKCAVCGKERPVTEMRILKGGTEGDTGFCVGTCWEKRGRIFGSEDGVGCPYYTKDRMCAPPQGDPSPCSFTFKIGPTYKDCPVYGTFPRIY